MIVKLYKIYIFLLTLFFILISVFNARANNLDGDEIVSKLVTLKIIDDGECLSEPVKRSEFSKILIKASKDKDKGTAFINESICNDVDNTHPYAGYIKLALQNSYMHTYLGGYFKPDEYVTYNDLTRACLTLLGYTNEDFIGNQIILRNQKFESLKLNDGIDKSTTDILTKLDILIGIYNTLREDVKDRNVVYAESIFEDVKLDRDNQLNVLDMIPVKVEGPFFINEFSDFSVPFEITDYNVYINGLNSNIKQVEYDLVNYGYIIYYYDVSRLNVYVYTEREDISAPIQVMKGYVQGIYYSAKDLTTPYRVDIDLHKYYIESEEMKFAFSPSGSFKENDHVIYLCNKINDVSKDYLDSQGKIVHNDDETEAYNGSLINVFHYSLVKGND